MVSGSQPIRATPRTSPSAKVRNSRHHLFHPTQEQGEWHGDAKKMLELGKYVKQAQWQNFAEGCSRDGSVKLVQNAGAPDRQAGVFFNFLAPKSLSTLYAAAAREIQEVIKECHKNAAKSGLSVFLEMTGIERKNLNGEVASWLVSSFFHTTTQTNDPHVHTHFFWHNLFVSADGKTGAIANEKFFAALKEANAVYLAELAWLLSERLWLKIIPTDKGGFDIEGVPRELCQAWSKRSVQIAEEKAKHGGVGNKAGNYAAHNTRGPKEMLSFEALDARWKATARRFGFTEEKVASLLHIERPRPDKTEEFTQRLRHTIQSLPESQRTRSTVVALGLTMAIDSGVSGERLKEALKEHKQEQQSRFVRLEWKPAFEKAPFWSPAKLVTFPRIVVGHRLKPRRWGNIRFERKAALGHVRVQDRILAPNAPKLSPLHGLKVPALRFGKMRLREHELWGKTQAKLNTKAGEIRLQNRKIFSRALKWNPAGKVSVPTIRFVPKSEIKKTTTFDRQQAH